MKNIESLIFFKLIIEYLCLQQVGKDRQLDYDPCFVSWFSKGEYVVAGGSNRQCNIYSREAVQLGVVGELSSWVWSAEVRPDANCVVSNPDFSILAIGRFFCYMLHL